MIMVTDVKIVIKVTAFSNQNIHNKQYILEHSVSHSATTTIPAVIKQTNSVVMTDIVNNLILTCNSCVASEIRKNQLKQQS